MELFYKYIIPLFLFPGVFILYNLVLLIILFIKKNEKYIRIGLIFEIILIYLLSIEPIKDLFVIPLERKFEIPSKERILKADCIIVLGSGINDNIKTYNIDFLLIKGVPTEIATVRLSESVKIYNLCKASNKNIKIILSGGQVFKDIGSEAEIYNNFLLAMNVSSNDIILENRSRTTFENAVNSYKILKENNYSNVIVLSSAIHLNRAFYVFNRINNDKINFIAYPCNYNSRYSRYNLRSFLPSAYNMEIINKALWEYIGILFYKLRI